MADYFEETVALICDSRDVCNCLIKIIKRRLSNLRKIADFPVKSEDLSQLIGIVNNGTIYRITPKIF